MGRDAALLQLHVCVGYVLHPRLLGCVNITYSVNSLSDVTVFKTEMLSYSIDLNLLLSRSSLVFNLLINQ